eukprot:g1942.t1
MEMLAALEMIIYAILALGKHLQAFKSKFTDRYIADEKELQSMSRLEEISYAIGPGSGATEGMTKKERLLLEDISINLLGPIPGNDLYTPAIAKVDQAGRDAYKSGLPDFMAKFLEDMKVATESHRQKNCFELREKCRSMRETILLEVGPAAFGDLLERALEELKQSVIALSKKMTAATAALDERRLGHEQRLTPSLANPNNARILQKLKDDEALRYKDAGETLNRFKLQFSNILHRESVSFLHRLTLTFQTLVRTLDALPLATHFNPLPGDENVQMERMSIKRRKRRVAQGHDKATPIEIDDEKLPPRTWEGVKTNLWELEGGFWTPENEHLAGRIKDPAGSAPASLTFTPPSGEDVITVPSFSGDRPFPQLQAQLLGSADSPAIDSFRTPVHKILFRRRNDAYAQYETVFRKEVLDIGTILEDRFAKEDAGEANWQNMCHQLVSGGEEE